LSIIIVGLKVQIQSFSILESAPKRVSKKKRREHGIDDAGVLLPGISRMVTIFTLHNNNQ
jgi:hypothetical protein